MQFDWLSHLHAPYPPATPFEQPCRLSNFIRWQPTTLTLVGFPVFLKVFRLYLYGGLTLIYSEEVETFHQ